MASGKGALRIAIEDFLIENNPGPKIKGWIKNLLETFELETIETYENMVNVLELAPHLPPQVQPDNLRRLAKHQVAFIAVLIPMVFQIIQTFSEIFVTPFLRPLGYIAEALVHTKHAGAPELLQMLRRRPDLEQKLRSNMIGSGFDEASLDGYDSLINQLLTTNDYQHLRLREAMSDEAVRVKLRQANIQDDDIDHLFELSKLIPPPNDLIRMAVREAFDESFIGRFQTAENLPPDFVEWAKKQGMSEEWSRRYWIAHWQLPSPNQVFEMLHRLRPGVGEVTVTPEIVSDYLRAADYSPFWRDKLQAISYAPYTRVDVRRMYKTGVLNEAQVKEAYLDLGYDDTHAQALTRFTIAYEAEEESGIVRSSVLQAYGDGMIDRSTAEGMLSSGGYDTTTVAFYLDNVDFRQALEVNQIKLTNIKRQFIEGLLDESSVNSKINELNLPGERVTALMDLWLTERENQIALPTLAQIENFYELGISTLDDFKTILKRRGYTDKVIGWNIERIDLEKAAKAQTAAEKIEADNERLQKSNTASQYQKDKSEIDLSIAQAKAEMTDIDVVLHGDISEEQIMEMVNRTDELKVFIAQMKVSKAQLRFDTQTKLQPTEA